MNILSGDTETGGFHPSIHALLSIGAVCSWTGETYAAYITAESQPGKSVDPDAARKNGYTRSHWEDSGARPLPIVIAEYLAWIDRQKKARPDAVLLFHHLAFDKGFLSEAARVCGLELPHRNDWVCSQVEFTKMMRLGILPAGSSSLNRLNELSGWSAPRAKAHDALEDALMALHGYTWLLNKGREAEATVKHLYDLCLQDRRRLEKLVCEVADYMNGQTGWDESGRIARIVSEEAASIRKEGVTHGT